MVLKLSSDIIRALSAGIVLSSVMVAPSLAQEPDTRPLVAVYPIKQPANPTVAGMLKADNLDSNLILLKTEEGLRNSKKMKLFERSASVLESVDDEQMRASCSGNSSAAPQSAPPNTVVGVAEIGCEKRFAGNAADKGKLSNVEFIVQIVIADLSIGNAVYRNIPEMPGKMRRSVSAKLDVAVKVLDSTSGQIKFQANVPAAYTESGIAQDKSEENVDKRAIWNGLANDAGRKIASAIVSIMN